jgi:hypothetical protein
MASGSMARQAHSEEDSGDVEFNPPQDLDSDLKGDSGQAECTWERKPDGKICITAINGVSIGPEKPEQEKESPEEDAGEQGEEP